MSRPDKTDFSDTLLLTVHGVRSDNRGLQDLGKYCKTKLPGLHVVPFNFGITTIREIRRKNLPKVLAQSLRDKIYVVFLTYKPTKFFIVAHSFGTLAVVRALEKSIPGIRIDGLVLLGSIAPQDELWDGFVASGQLSLAPLAVIRPFDTVVQYGKYVGGGPSGAEGFFFVGDKSPSESYKSGGHVSYYPHDRDDVVKAVSEGVESVNLISRDDWQQTLTLGNRVRSRVRKIPGLRWL